MRISDKSEKTGINILSDDEELSEIYDQWIDLYKLDKKPNPFKSPLWLLPWRETFKGGELRAFIFYSGGELKAAAPMYIHNFTHPYVRELTFLGTGNSDYTDILAGKDYENEFLPSLFDDIFSMDDWDMLNLFGIREDSALLNFAREKFPAIEIVQESASPYIPLPDTIDEYNKLLGSKKIKRLKYAERKLMELGSLRLEKADMYTIAMSLESMFSLHNKSQMTRGKQGVFSDYKMKNFLRKAAMGLLDFGMMELYSLKLELKTIASIFALREGKIIYYYIGGFDPELGKYSPGSLCIYKAIEDAISQGIKEFDFMKGDEAYKYHWGSKERKVYNLKYQN